SPVWVTYVGVPRQRRWETQGHGADRAGGTIGQHAAHPGSAYYRRTYSLWCSGAPCPQHTPGGVLGTCDQGYDTMEILLERCLQARRPTVLVVGDVMCDVYLLGSVRRISTEAPVPIFESTARHH